MSRLIRHHFLLFLLLAAASACDPFDWSFDEVARFTSPSGKVDAILVEQQYLSTNTSYYAVYLAPKGKTVYKNDEEIANIESAVVHWKKPKVNLRWDGANNLLVEYTRTEKAEPPRNIVATIEGEQITVSLRPDTGEQSGQPQQ